MTITTCPVASTRPRGRITDHSDEELLVGTRLGSAASYAELYRRYEPEIRRYARAVAHGNDVDDVVAEAFTKMLRALQNDKGPVEFAAPYLMVAVRRTAAGLHAKRARGHELTHKIGPPRPTEDTMPLLGDDHLVTAFRSLGERHRQVIWWAEVEGVGASDIGERLDISPNAAAALTYRARRALRDAFVALDRQP